jgi:hypothetical protein
MPPSTRRQPHHQTPPPQAEFSGSEEDLDEEEMDPEEDEGDVMADNMRATEGEEEIDEDGLGKSFLAACPHPVERDQDFTCSTTLFEIPSLLSHRNVEWLMPNMRWRGCTSWLPEASL